MPDIAQLNEQTPDRASLSAEVSDRLAAVRERITAAGGDAASVQIVAVTKGFGPQAVSAAYSAGLRTMGENYGQELMAKRPAVEELAGLSWHFLGAIQRNKVGRLASVVDCWQGLADSGGAEALARRRAGTRVLVQVNMTGEPGRNGALPDHVPALVELADSLGLEVGGLMTVGPARDPAGARRCFAGLDALAGALGLTERSMGMSDDLEIAVAEGSTMLRLGRALFGPRPGKDPISTAAAPGGGGA